MAPPRACARRALAALAAGVGLLATGPATTQASTFRVVPDATQRTGDFAPNGADSLHAATAKTTESPTVPPSLPNAAARDGAEMELHLSGATLPPGQTVTGASLLIYLINGSRTTVVRFRGGVGNLRQLSVSGNASGWFRLDYAGSLTQAQIDDLRVAVDPDPGPSSNAWPVIRAIYAEVQSTGPPSTPAISAATASPGSTLDPSLSFTGEGSSSFECQARNEATPVTAWSACASPAAFSLSGQPDGAYTLAVRGVDREGTRSAEATHGYTLDTTAPAAPAITTAPADPSTGATPSWSFTAEAGTTRSCRLTRGATIIGDWTTCTSPRAYDLTSRVDGTYTFAVRATDAAGNTGAASTSSYTLDRTPPAAPTITSGPPASTATATATYAATAEPGATLSCRLDRGATIVSDWAACTSPRAYDLAGEADGTYRFRVRATDTAGNTSAEATRDHALDRTAPAAPTITSGPAGDTNDPAPSFGWNGEAGASPQCRLERGATVVQDWIACTSPRAWALAGEADGAYVFKVRDVDAAANTGAASSRAFTLDRVAPAAPVLTAQPPAQTNDATADLAWTATAPTSCRVERDGTPLGAWAACASPWTRDLTGEPDGAYVVRVRATDAAGNAGAEATAAFTLDRVAPGAPSITGQPALVSDDATPTWAFTAAGGTTTACRLLRGAITVAEWATCTSPSTHDLTGLPDALYTFEVRAVDAAGNTSAPASHSTTLDRQAPAAPSITAGPPALTKDPSTSWSFTSEDGAMLACRLLRAGAQVEAWASCTSPSSRDLAGYADGTFRFEVRATDVAGNTGPATAREVVLDRTAPAAPTITSAPAALTADDTQRFTFTGEPAATFECRYQGLEGWAACTSPRDYDLSSSPDGVYTFGVRATDAAGNTGAEATRSVTLDTSLPPSPTITGDPGAATSDITPEFTFDGVAESFRCRLEREGAEVEAWTTCTSPRGYAIGSHADGTFVFEVVAVNGAGTESGATSFAFELDRVAPASPAWTSTPADPSSDATPTWAWTSEPGARSLCELLRDGVSLGAPETCASPRTPDLAGAPDGTYTLRVRVRDDAGNESPAVAAAFVLDRAAPAVPSIVSGPAARTADATPTFTFSAPGAVATTCRLTKDGIEAEAAHACSSPHTDDLSGAPDGTYVFWVSDADAAGNVSAEASHTFVLDRSPPARPTIAGPQGDTNANEPTWTVAAEAAATLECRLLRDGAEVDAWAACTSPVTRTLAQDGTWTLAVRATDEAGNTGAAAERVLRLDRAAPAAPAITSGPAARTADDTPTWTFAGEAGATLECRLDGGAWTPCAASQGYDLTGAADGAFTFAVRASDAAGNTGPTSTATVVLDRDAPAAPSIGTRPADATSDATPAWTFTTEAGAAALCRLERQGVAVADWSACTSPYDADLTAQPDGSWTFRVRATDAAGNVGVAASHAFTLDRAAPAAPGITGGPAARSADNTPTWTISTDAGTTLECRVDRATVEVQGWAACASPATFDLGDGADGTYVLGARASDAAGNTGPTATASYDLDRTAPAGPSITAAPADATNDPVLTWSFTSEAGAAFECRLETGSTPVTGWTACTSPQSYDRTAAGDGDHGFAVRAIDDVGNVGPATTDRTTLDRVAPTQPAITGGPVGATSETAPSWTFTTDDGTAGRCRMLREGVVIRGWAACDSPTTVDIAASADGDFRFEVAAVDAAGNAGTAATRTITLDRVGPAAPVVDGPDARSADGTPTWTWTVEAGATVQCRLTRGATELQAWAACTSPLTTDLGSGVDGTYLLAVRATDPAGNAGGVGTASFDLDRTPPAAPVIATRPADATSDPLLRWTWTGEGGATFECRLERGGTEVSTWAACTSPKTYDRTAGADGDHGFAVRAVDDVGNTSESATDRTDLDRVAPAAPAFTGGPAGPTNDTTPAWTFTHEGATTTRCRLERAGVEVVAWTACGSGWERDVAALADGSFAVHAEAIDAAGNRSAAASRSWSLDRVAPAAPSIGGGPDPVSTDDTPSWTLGGEAGATFTCRVLRGAVEVASTCAGIDLSARADAVYAFEARATDIAGNTGAAATASYRLDRTPPPAPAFTAEPAAEGRSTAPAWSFTIETGAIAECRLRRDATTLDDWATCASPATAGLGGQADGTYQLDVRALGENGLRGAARTGAYRLDRTAPAAPVVTSGPAAVSPDDTPEWTFAAEAGTTTQCRVEQGATVLADWDTCSTPAGFDLSGAPDAIITFRVRAVDPATNAGPSATATYRLDRAVPGTPVLTAQPPAAGSSRTPAWAFTLDADRTAECRLTPPSGTVPAWTACTSPYAPSLGADGTWTFAVRSVAPNGRQGEPVVHAYLLDTQGPASPAMTGGPGALGNRNDPSWSFAVEPGAGAQCRLLLEGAELRPWAACASPAAYALAGAPDGLYRFEVQATDPAGNASAVATGEHRLDRVGPSGPVFTAAPGPTGTGRTPQWAFTSEAGATFECRLDPGGTWGPCASPRAADLGGRPDGRYAMVVRAIDAAGNRGAETLGAYELDTTGGAVQIVGGPASIGRDRSIAWAFAGDAGGGYQCRLALGGAVLRDWGDCAARFDGDLTGRPDGVVTLGVRTIDGLGNVGPVTEARYLLDTTAPAAPEIVEAPAERGSDRTPTWRFNAEPGSVLTCRLEVVGDGREATWAPCTSPHTERLEQAEAQFRFAVRARDAAGNTGAPATRSHTLERASESAGGSAERQGAAPTAATTTTTKAPATGPSLGAPREEAEVRSEREAAARRRREAASAAAAEKAAAARGGAPTARRSDGPSPGAPGRRDPGDEAAAAARERRRADDESASGPVGAVAAPVARAVADVAAAVVGRPDAAAFPLGLLVLVASFLGLQGRIDRKDPKLVLRPSSADEDLEFPDDAPVA